MIPPSNMNMIFSIVAQLFLEVNHQPNIYSYCVLLDQVISSAIYHADISVKDLKVSLKGNPRIHI